MFLKDLSKISYINDQPTTAPLWVASPGCSRRSFPEASSAIKSYRSKNTLQFARSEIHQDEHLLSDQLFGREMFGDSRNYLAFVDTRINRQFQQFLRFGDFFGRQNRRNANIHFLKIVELNRIF